VNGNYRLGSRAYGLLNGERIEIEVAGIHIDENWLGSGVNNYLDRGGEGHGRDYDLITRPHVVGHHGKV
jgi:hypothetical protein